MYQTVFGFLEYEHPTFWLLAHRYIYNTGIPQFYCIDGDVKYPNRLVVRLAPMPTDSSTLDFIYKRRPRPLLIQAATTGTVTVTGGQTLVTGTGTAFNQTMVGSVIRLSSSGPVGPNPNIPTWMPGANPAVEEALIFSVTNATSLNVMPLTPFLNSWTNVSYVISDPIDIETGSMQNAFLRAAEWKLSQLRIMEDKELKKAQYLDELRRAKEADTRSFAGRAEGELIWNRMRMKDMPMGPDAS